MGGGGGAELDDARRIVLDACRTLPRIAVELDSALGRVLAEDVTAERPLPPFDSSAMDGFAVSAADVAGATDSTPVWLELEGESRAGRPSHRALAAGSAMAISTGAMIPDGADAVVRVERTRPDGRGVSVLAAVEEGADVRRAGEDVRAGERVLGSGTCLGAAELGMLAALGRARVQCARPPLVSVLVTGDELLGPDQPAVRGAVRDVNSHSLGALARRCGAHVLRTERLVDRRCDTEAAIAAAALDSHVVVICGGMSVGRHDHVRPALAALGARERLWRVALKPGHPTWFGMLDDTLVFGLPGNPVSAMVTFILLACPALAALQGASPARPRLTAILDEGYSKARGRTHALRCSLRAEDDGWHARLTGPQGSHVLSSMLSADALALIPSSETELAAGTRVQVEPLVPWSRAG